MSDRSEAARQALAELAGLVAGELAVEGWQRRELGLPSLLVLTKPIGGGVIATAVIDRPASFPQSWAEELFLVRGVGFEPALGLKPLLTLPADPSLLLEHGPDGATAQGFELVGPGAVHALSAHLR